MWEGAKEESKRTATDGGDEGCAFISCKSTKITTSYWMTIDRRMLELTKKKYTLYPKTKKLQQDGRRDIHMMKSNPIPTWWVTCKLENNNTKEVLPLFWKFSTPCQASQPGDPTKGLGIPKESDFEGQQDLITRLPQDWGKQRLQSWRAQTKLCLHQDSEKKKKKEQWLNRRLNQKYLLVLEGLLWRSGWAGTHCRDRGTGYSCLRRFLLT